MQSGIRLVFPPQCCSCGGPAATDFALCPECWRSTAFIGGLVCDSCGTPLPGEETGQAEYCDDCLTLARPWGRGRAAFLYKGAGRGMILALKHGDRLDLVRPAAGWLARAAGPILTPDMLVAPIPLHRLRLLLRRYNQSALLGEALARHARLDFCPDLLVRTRRTGSQDGRDRDGRFANVSGTIAPHPRRGGRMAGRHILLVDDVMTSGATFAAAAEACLAAGASTVSVLALARVAKDA